MSTSAAKPRQTMPLAEITFLHRKNVICPSNVGISRDKTVYLSVPMPSMWGVGRSLFTLWLEVPIKDRHYNPIRSLVANGRVDEHERKSGK